MIIVNTTFLLADEVSDEALSWMRDAYGASAVKCGAVADPMVVRVLSHAEPGTVVYAIHATFADQATAVRWSDGVGERLRRKLHERWGDRALAFVTLLEIV